MQINGINRRTILIAVLSGIAVMSAVWGATHRQDTRDRAQYPVCPDNSASCRWESSGPGVRYRYRIVDTTALSVVTEGETGSPWVRFTPVVHHSYRCEVIPFTSCGSGPISRLESMCGEAGVVTPTMSAIPATSTPAGIVESKPTRDPFLLPKTVSAQFPTSAAVPEAGNFVADPVVPPKRTPTPAVVRYDAIAAKGINIVTYLLLVLVMGTVGLVMWQKIHPTKRK